MTTGSSLRTLTNGLPLGSQYSEGTKLYKQWGGDNRVPYKRAFYLRSYYKPKVGVVTVALPGRATYRKPLPSQSDAPHYWGMVGYVRVWKPAFRFGPGDIKPIPTNGYAWAPNYAHATFSSNDDIRLISKLREQIVGSDFDLGVFLGTGHQSLKLIADSALRMAGFIRHLKKGNFLRASRYLSGNAFRVSASKRKARILALQDAYRRLSDEIGAAKAASDLPSVRKLSKRSAYLVRQREKSRRLPRDIEVNLPPERERDRRHIVAAAFLEMQYGWRPLVQDLKGGAESLAESTRPKRKRYFAQAKASFPSGYCDLRTGTGYIAGSINPEISASKRIIAYIEEQNVPTMVSLLDPLTVLHELTPWSFVADWVIPIGDYLSARGFASRTSGVFVTTLRQYIESKVFKYAGFGTTYTFPGTSFRAYQFTRNVSTSLSVPSPEVKGFGQVLSWQRAANAVALLAQNLRN